MLEDHPKPSEQKFEAETPPEMTRKERYISLARELFVSQEHFPFTGIDPDVYPKIKAAEAEYPGYTTPIDDLIKRFESEGVKVVLGRDPESGNVFILPAQSDDIEQDSISPRQLQIVDAMDEKLKTLILMDRR